MLLKSIYDDMEELHSAVEPFKNEAAAHKVITVGLPAAARNFSGEGLRKASEDVLIAQVFEPQFKLIIGDICSRYQSEMAGEGIGIRGVLVALDGDNITHLIPDKGKTVIVKNVVRTVRDANEQDLGVTRLITMRKPPKSRNDYFWVETYAKNGFLDALRRERHSSEGRIVPAVLVYDLRYMRHGIGYNYSPRDKLAKEKAIIGVYPITIPE